MSEDRERQQEKQIRMTRHTLCEVEGAVRMGQHLDPTLFGAHSVTTVWFGPDGKVLRQDQVVLVDKLPIFGLATGL